MNTTANTSQPLDANLFMSIDSDNAVSVCKEAISTFLENLQLHTFTYKQDLDFEATARKHLRPLGLSDGCEATAIMLAVMAYNHLPTNTQLQVTLYTAVGVWLDAKILEDSSTFHTFHERFYSGSTQLNVPLDRFSKLLIEMPNHFSWFAAQGIVTSSLDFISATLFESQSTSLVLRGGALPFVNYRRRKSGIGEAFAYFVWEKESFPDVNVYVQAIPDVALYLERINDILSFYKEELAGETENYIKDRAFVTGQTVQQCLYEVVDETVATSRRIHKTLGEGRARDVWDRFEAGFVSFHVESPRYRLKEIIGSK